MAKDTKNSASRENERRHTPLDQLKRRVSPGSTAGKLRDRPKERERKIREAGG